MSQFRLVTEFEMQDSQGRMTLFQWVYCDNMNVGSITVTTLEHDYEVVFRSRDNTPVVVTHYTNVLGSLAAARKFLDEECLPLILGVWNDL